MHLLHYIVLAGSVSLVTAMPEPTATPLDKRIVNCKAVNLALTVLKNLGPPATSFCSSYLKIPATKTVSTTTTTPITTTTISTTTVTVTSAVCAPQRRRSPGELSNDRTSGDHLDKRINIPALSAFAAAKISSGCSCLNLAPKTSVTATVTAQTSTVEVVATTTTCTVPAPVCNADGVPCDFFDPGACCGQACIQAFPVPVCTSF